ncbi:hypothetical protein A374_09528 [Fictibacillus macauensis ZFHKF-1]|uniref:Amidohydrolase 3 domain-containing protein n=1 Tax=Fictibacillus macauensis ZFHKF-1 TaxID=1196324 RepID=I8AID8_9BACL|nr:amidohydrolase [Fictibacillus macauensis]EIT85467.1 hypothetical protein A374_09528 [Fictibacillus macauensis ZFHKF-1]
MGTLYSNGTIYTMEATGSIVEAVYVSEGKIVATGSKKELVSTFQEELTEEVDLCGHTMFPGFVDSHMHLIGFGETLISRDLSAFTSQESMLHYLKREVSAAPEGTWIIGEGWNENQFPDAAIPTLQALDALSTKHPIFLSRICRHSFIVNSQALQLAGITKETPQPEGGVIVRNERGEATGLLLDGAGDLVKRVIPKPSPAYLDHALHAGISKLISYGLTGCHTEDLSYYGGFERTYAAFERFFLTANIPFNIHLLIHHRVVDDYCQSKKASSPYLEGGAMKIFSDGAFGGRTALLEQPYEDDPTTSGVAIHTEEELSMLVQKARKRGMAVAIHTIGDRSLSYVLKALREHPPTSSLRDRVIHAGLVSDQLLQEMQQLPLIIDVQPSFVTSDFPWLAKRLGPERTPYAFAFKTLLAHGLHCAGGSDAPIESANPLEGIYAAITRKRPYDQHGGYEPQECLTPFEAVSLYTSGSAYSIGHEKDRGYIKAGYDADFTVFDRDLLQCHVDEIVKANVMYTIVNNTIVYKREQALLR